MRIVGDRTPREVSAFPSGEALKEGARFIEELSKLPGAGSTFIPKGVYRFKTHEDAERHRLECLASGMAELARERAKR